MHTLTRFHGSQFFSFILEPASAARQCLRKIQKGLFCVKHNIYKPKKNPQPLGLNLLVKQ